MATFVWTDIITETYTVSSPSVSPVTSIDRLGTESTRLTKTLQQTTRCESCASAISSATPFTTDVVTGIYTELMFVSMSRTPVATLDNSSAGFDTSSSPSPTLEASLGDDEFSRRFIVGFLSVLLAVSITVGNIMVILAVYRERQLRSITNFFIVSLACADFLIGTVVLPFSIHMEITQGYWPFGVVWCDLWHAFDILGCTASILNLCAIACDRYWAITRPFSYPTRMTKRIACLWIGIVWVCSALISFPCILWWRAIEAPHPPLQCIFPLNTIYLVTSSCVSFYVPSIIMVFMYLKIYCTAVGQVRAIRAGTKRVKTTNGDGIAMRVHKGGGGIRTVAGSLQERSATNNNSLTSQGVKGAVSRRASLPGKRLMSRLSREHKAARTLGIVMGVFVICWLPFFIVNVVAPLCPTCYFHPIIIGMVTWLGYVNSALNPIIYAFASRRFKRAFARILCAWKHKQRRCSLASQRPRSESVIRNNPHLGDTSLTQYSEDRNSMETSSSAHSNLKYTLPYVYF